MFEFHYLRAVSASVSMYHIQMRLLKQHNQLIFKYAH